MSDGAKLELRHEDLEGGTLLHATGEVDLTNADELQRAIEETDASTVVLDVSGLGYIDSSGIRAIERGHRAVCEDGRTFFVVTPPDTPAGWTLKVAGFNRRLVQESVESALAVVAEQRG